MQRKATAASHKARTFPEYAGFAETVEGKGEVLHHQDIEFDIYRHPYPTHIHVNPQEGCTNQSPQKQQPYYNEYLYTLRLENSDVHKDPTYSSEGILGQAGGDVISGDVTPVKKCTCRHGQTYEMPAGLHAGKTTTTTSHHVAGIPGHGSHGDHTKGGGVCTYLEWERSSLLQADHEPDVIHVAKTETDNDG